MRIRTNPKGKPDRVLIAGVEGVGKSSFAASFPAAVILAAEDGVDHIERDDTFSAVVAENDDGSPIKNWPDTLAAIRWLAKNMGRGHDRKTLIIDSIDWLEAVCQADLCESRGWVDDDGHPDIEAPGYGKGYVAAADHWRRLIYELDRARSAGLVIVMVAHTTIKPFSNPSGFDFSRYELALHKTAAAISREWVDTHLFLTWEQIEAKKKDEKKVKGSATGRRIAHAQRSAAWDAKCRWGVPASFLLNDNPAEGYATYSHHRAAGGRYVEPTIDPQKTVDVAPDPDPEPVAPPAKAQAAKKPAERKPRARKTPTAEETRKGDLEAAVSDGQASADELKRLDVEARRGRATELVKLPAADLLKLAGKLIDGLQNGHPKKVAAIEYFEKHQNDTALIVNGILNLERIATEVTAVSSK